MQYTREDIERARERQEKNVVSLNKAATLVAAQRTMELYPALRRSNDTNALKRRDVGVVNDATFQSLKKNLEPVVISDDQKFIGK